MAEHRTPDNRGEQPGQPRGRIVRPDDQPTEALPPVEPAEEVALEEHNLSPVEAALAASAPPAHRNQARLMWAAIGLAVLLIAAIVAGVLILGDRGQDAVAQRDQLGAVAVPQADALLNLCGGTAGPDVAKAVADAGLCHSAAVVKSQASEAGLPTATAAPTVDQGTLRNYVTASVASYCATHHDCTPDTASIVPIVAAYLTAHPPAAVAPTAEQVKPVVDAVLAANPDAFKGDKGDPGKDAPPVTDGQVAAQVAAYCAANQCGTQGPQGVSVVRLDFETVDGECRAVVTLFDPASGNQSTVSAPAGAAACPVVEPPPTTTTEPPDTTETPGRRGGGLGGLLGGG